MYSLIISHFTSKVKRPRIAAGLGLMYIRRELFIESRSHVLSICVLDTLRSLLPFLAKNSNFVIIINIT